MYITRFKKPTVDKIEAFFELILPNKGIKMKEKRVFSLYSYIVYIIELIANTEIANTEIANTEIANTEAVKIGYELKW